ncbi:hypothetical protein E8E11_008109 [Didymella keratinophila]|nr:hypothetical protein E8E11_008109 [Didymella keratinophila]
MKLLEEAGIYVFTSVYTIFSSINRAEPYKSYHRPALDEYFHTVNVMAQYPNTLGLLAGNSVTNGPRNQRCVPVIKAVVRDLKRYMKLHHEATGQRILPIGYTAATVDLLDMTALDFLSQGDPASSIDFWTVMQLLYVGRPSNYQISGYGRLVTRLQRAALPIFMSEYGVNIQTPRKFEETAALYSPAMSQVFSGGCVYEFWEGLNAYGLVELVDQEHARSTPAWAVEKRRERALARADDPKKTAEKRQTERGPISIFYDFANYKANLDKTRDIDHVWEGDVNESEAAARGNVDTSQRQWPWEPENQIPDTVADWMQIEDIVVEALTKNVKEDHIREIFGKYGTIKDLRMPMNPVFNVNRGTAYIMYEEIEDAERAIAKMHEAQLDGAKIQVSIVLPRRRFSQTPPPRRGGPPPRFQDDHNGHGGGGPPGAYRPPPMGGYGGGRSRGRSPSPRGGWRGRGRGRGRGGRGGGDFGYRPRSYSRSRSRSPRRSMSRSSYSRSPSRTPPRRRGGGGGYGRRDSPPRRGGRGGGGRRSPSYDSYDSPRSRSRSRDRR